MNRVRGFTKRRVNRIATLGLGLLVLGAVAAGPALAQTSPQTDNMAVSATVTDNCTISAGALAFGNYNPINATDVDAEATLTLTCTLDASATITLGQGANADGTSTAAIPVRRMLFEDKFLTYDLFSDSGRTLVWQAEGGTGVAYTGIGSVDTSVQVFGRIPGGQSTLPTGDYTDTVVVTITF
jgi:spore coat protein U-like protein